MFGLFCLLALLGLSAIDPVGIAAMPILLLQNHPYKRSLTFLAGSFTALMVMGLLFAKGIGLLVLHFDTAHTGLIKVVEATAGVVLVGIAATLLWRTKRKKPSIDPPAAIKKRLRLGYAGLFATGALLVLLQSLVDVVFIIAMIRVGKLQLNSNTLVAAVATYAIAALVLQFAVVAAYWITPATYRTKTLQNVRLLLAKYANQALIGVSLLIGCTLLGMAILG